MQALRSLTGATQDSEPSASVLAEWNKYSGDTSSADVETGAGGQAPASTSATSAFMVGLAGAKLMQKTFSSGFSYAATSVQDGASTVQTNMSSFTMPTTQQFTYFAAFMAGGIFFLILSFTIALPVIVIAPAKFAFSFTMGCGLIMSAFAALKGWKAQVSHMMQKERLPFSIGYISSMLGTLYAAMVMHSYLLSIICSAAQVVALLYYVMSYFPGGTAGVKLLLNMMYRTAASCFTTASRAVVG
mmetsp:Transcript_10588/g.30161  ORF Transcript_10588/g.30161 Transcript_10588/m.30161 type:complete len:244 (-) Transcript_10588:85-816(-)